MSNNPDKVVSISPKCCENCQSDLTRQNGLKQHSPRQVKDINKPEWIITEYQGEDKCCPYCQHINKAVFPEGVTNHIQYGHNITAQLVYLNHFQHIPYERLQQMTVDFYDCKISTGTIEGMATRFAKKIGSSIESIREYLKSTDVICVDETGMQIDKMLEWLHVVSGKYATLYQAHDKRGCDAIDENAIIANFHGTMVHDCYSSYSKYVNCLHSLCNAHIIRELVGVFENTGQDWTNQLIELLITGKNRVAHLKGNSINCMELMQIEELEAGYDELIQRAHAENPVIIQGNRVRKRGRVAKTDAQNLIARLEKNKALVLRFIRDFNVPFDNNLAERDVRMAKLKQKISGCFRSWAGAHKFASIRSFMSTVRKNGLSVFDEIISALVGEPFLLPTE